MSHVQVSEMPKRYRSKAKIDKASSKKLDDLMGICHEEPADFEGCLACYAYLVAQNREIAEEKANIPTPGERWERGIDHDHRSEKLIRAMARIDFEHNNDELCIKFGGDGDNGETMMYLLDYYFAEQDL